MEDAPSAIDFIKFAEYPEKLSCCVVTELNKDESQEDDNLHQRIIINIRERAMLRCMHHLFLKPQ